MTYHQTFVLQQRPGSCSVYKLFCTGCLQQCIGKTGRSLALGCMSMPSGLNNRCATISLIVLALIIGCMGYVIALVTSHLHMKEHIYNAVYMNYKIIDRNDI